MFKAISRVLLTAALILPAYAADPGTMAPLNPAFEAWRDARRLSGQNRNATAAPPARSHRITGKRPTPLNLRHLYNQSILPPRTAMDATPAFPERMDLRESGKVSGVKDQDPWGTCWSFAALGSSESSALSLGWSTADFSEKHLAYFAYTDIDSKRVGFDVNPEDSLYEQGANAPVPIAMLSRWTGIVAEKDAPYSDFNAAPQALIPNTALLRNTYFAPAGEHFVENLKYLLQTTGAVNIDVYIDSAPNAADGDPSMQGSFNPANGAFYYTGAAKEGNHAVLAVGWDDRYSRDNFLQPPPGDGAWIVQNSWGSGWGDQGYFYVSYYDACTGKHEGEDAYGYVVTAPGSDNLIHFHDALGATGAYALDENGGPQWFSNLFRAEEDQSIRATGLYTLHPNTTLTISLYTDPEADNPSSGTLAFGPWTVTRTIPGYHVLDFDRDIPVQTNQRFSIVVQIQAPGADFPIAIEGPVEEYSSKATALLGESFVSADGITWQDMSTKKPDTNVCLKALATRKAATPDPAPAPASGSGSSGCFLQILFR